MYKSELLNSLEDRTKPYIVLCRGAGGLCGGREWGGGAEGQDPLEQFFVM